MEKPKSFNAAALMGMDVDDMEYVEEFELDFDLAYTPRINDAMLEKIYEENIAYYTEVMEMDAKAAREKAKAQRAMAEAQIKELMARKGMLEAKNDGE